MLAAGADGASVVSADTDSTLPASSPPPSYERVLEEVRQLNKSKKAKMGLDEDEEAIEESTDEGKAVPKPAAAAAAPPTAKTKARSKKAAAAAAASAEIMPYKSSKEFYKAMAKQWGITCKMSDNCRCLDCQSRYFECSYDKYQDHDTYQEQSDGGLSASTPIYVSEIMHGSTCLLL